MSSIVPPFRKRRSSSKISDSASAPAASGADQLGHVDDSKFTQVELDKYVVPDITVKELLSAIPSRCFDRSALRSSLYILLDVVLVASIFTATYKLEPYIYTLNLPHPFLYSLARFCLWTFYGFAAGLPATGIWVIAHECGHQAFSKSKTINNTVGWVLHSALGVPYHSWRISHGKHHAHTGHMTNDQVFVPKTRSTHPWNLPALDLERENVEGSRVHEEASEEYWELIGDTPIGAFIWCALQLTVGWPLYLLFNTSGQKYSNGVHHFVPRAPLYSAHQYWQIIASDIGIFIWLAGLATWTYMRGFNEMASIYLVPYLWVNHWLVLITYLQHTDPRLPHYRAESFTFPRGALATLDRQLMGGPGPIGKVMGWIGGFTTHGISETHVAHHVASKIPHYHAWEAANALRGVLRERGYDMDGGYATWGEVMRVYKACKFVEDEGDVVFYKDARGFARTVAVFNDPVSDSGIDVGEDK